MGSVLRAAKVLHAVQTRKRSTATGISMAIKFLLGEDVSAVLVEKIRSVITSLDGR
jgi:hypothetical protein